MREDSELHQRKYEEAVFKVYGTPPSRKISFPLAEKKKHERNSKN